MAKKSVKYKDWEFEVDLKLTRLTYKQIPLSGTESCGCTDCNNYIALRDKIFPVEIKNLLSELGIDFRKEVEITTWQLLPGKLQHIGGWFHFKGSILAGKTYRIPNPERNGYTSELTEIVDNFKIGFAPGNDLTFFKDKNGLVQLEFETIIPWTID